MVELTTEALWYANPTSRGWSCEPPVETAIEFHRGLPGYAPTPLVESPALAAKLGVGRVFIKDESQRFDLGAFKFLGASWAVHRTIAENPTAVTITTATDGNHGRAVARMARELGLDAVVFMPRAVPVLAVDRVRAEGAEVTVLETDYDGAVKAARAYADSHQNVVIVQDTAWEGYEDVPGWIVEGYSTLFVEIDEQLAQLHAPEPTIVAVPAGVGSLAQAAVAHYRNTAVARPPRLLAVEPDTAACVLASVRSGRLESVETAGTIMNGLNCGTPSSLAWPYLRGGLDAVIAVTDAACRAGMETLASAGVPSGPSGAAAFTGIRAALTGAGAAERRAQLGIDASSTIVCLSTEGPIR
ncbi:pyridoxal-phosphate dependent enzyme [Gryllotalpicola reticulitermitis]|uniref:Pyridoxal-phosphate dependent enzyme n=1 Tax=Gryllotalpicola reticulitermitis TaxID=1184153 RepID=A0ABV8Q7A8_9MICO